jgi:UDP-N-acetylmuramate--alanine ligase
MNDADVAIVAPVYAAGEQPIEGFSRDSFAEALRAHGHRDVRVIEGAEDLPTLIRSLEVANGAIVFLGAGSITQWAHGLEGVLQKTEEGT